LKPVLLVVIDALASRVILPAMRNGQLPTLQNLSQRGKLREECISIFPSITPAATSSILTGDYPSEHGVAGAFFYNTDEDRVRYFGTDIWAILREGFSSYFNDFGVKLNEEILESETLFELAAEHRLSTGSLNYLIYHGPVKHNVESPWIFKMWPGINFEKHVHGPDMMVTGDFVSTLPHAVDEEANPSGGMFNRFGFQDKTTAELLLQVAKSDAWPDFLVAYFPDNDFDSHREGPASALATVQKVDQCLAEMIALSGGFENFLERRSIMILGDHAQSDLIADADARAVDLNEALSGFNLVEAGHTWSDQDQLMVCPNMRAAQIYLRHGYQERLDEISAQLTSDRRVDQVIWRRPPGTDCSTEFQVLTADRGSLRFSDAAKGGDSTSEMATDEFGNSWNIEGDLDTIDATVTDGEIVYRSYPNALERISTSFHCKNSGDVWVTAAEGYEFVLPETSVHGAGSHGSLHEHDSLTPLICAGLPDDVKVPDPIRTIDVAKICRDVLGIS